MTNKNLSCSEVSFDIWDWTQPCQDLTLFEQWVKDLARLGVTRIEISTPWNQLEPQPGVYDLSFIEKRRAICKAHGLGMRLRISSFWAGALPEWYEGEMWQARDGKGPGQAMPSLADERFWKQFGPLCTTIARRFAGEDMIYNAFIGMHAELKFGDWGSYDPQQQQAWRKASLSPRPAWLDDVFPTSLSLPQEQPAPIPTDWQPDTDAVDIAYIAFREQIWREAMAHFTQAIREGDPNAKISSPLGESYRREGAQMGNLDYWGLTRGSNQVVHSYDFFWHAGEAPWNVKASIRAFQGITGLPVCFEFDGPNLMTDFGYQPADLATLAQTAGAAGAGLKIANYSYDPTLPSQRPVLAQMIAAWKAGASQAQQAAEHPIPLKQTVLLMISKRAHWAYRQTAQEAYKKGEWLHEAQFGLWLMLDELKVPVRIICEDNLGEDLSDYGALIRAFGPDPLLGATAKLRLEALGLPTLIDVPSTPAMRHQDEAVYAQSQQGSVCVAPKDFMLAPCDLSSLAQDHQYALQMNDNKLAAWKQGHVVLGYPIGCAYLNGDDKAAQLQMLRWALNQLIPFAPVTNTTH